MAIIKAVSSKASIGKAIDYITKDEKTEEKLISGIDCNPDTAIEEMKTTKVLWHKTQGRQYKHYVHSFSSEEKITPEQAHEIARELCNDRFNGFEVLISTHKDKDHIHSHIIVNSVSFEDGHKIQQSKSDLEKMKQDCNELSLKYGLKIPQKADEITTFNLDKYKVLEKSITGNYKSYVFECYKAVSKIKEESISKEDFVARMKEQGYETNWSENRKYITFTDQEGNKIRNNNLEKTFKELFGKEDLEIGFKANIDASRRIIQAREQLRNVKSENFDTGSVPGDREFVVEDINASIRESKDKINLDDCERSNRAAYEQSHELERNRIKEQEISKRNSRNYNQER